MREMEMWEFLSRGRGETEGYSNGSLAEFKGNPLQALAREVCQNSLDAADGSGKPVIVEFEKQFMEIDRFPGMESMRDVIRACSRFWKGKGDSNTMTFLNRANDCLKWQKFDVLRISDYNTTGVSGAFSSEDITPWGSLVKGNAFSVKTDVKNAAGSYGIGKAAPFISSYFQTVFYRTLDSEGVRAAMGVARLMAHESVLPVPEGEDPVRRSVGYCGSDKDGKPAKSFEELDALNKRESCGTDLFIPGFNGIRESQDWEKDILKEIVENFLYSIYSGKLEIRMGKRTLTGKNLAEMLDYIGSKDAKIFYEVIRDNPSVQEEIKEFHGMGKLRLRLLYGNDLNKKILVVRNSGMRIAKIPSLPRTVSYTGFLELQGSELNQFFRAMENPSHNAWEPKRHGNPTKAKLYKNEVESWVVAKITEKLLEISGEECNVDIGDCLSYEGEAAVSPDPRKKERLLDQTREIKTDTYLPQLPKSGKISIHDEGKAGGPPKLRGREDPNGEDSGYRQRTGDAGGQKRGRKVTEDPNGNATVNVGPGGKSHEVGVTARIIRSKDGLEKLIFKAEENIDYGRIEIVTRGENGKSQKLTVESVEGENVSVEDGRIVLTDVVADVKKTVLFRLADKQNYALGVKAYGD